MKASIEEIGYEIVPDEDSDTSYLEQECFEERREEYERGAFGFVGVRAYARIFFGDENGIGVYGPSVESPGLWGIEDDSGDDYFKEIFSDEMEWLRPMLEALGFTAAEIREAMPR